MSCFLEILKCILCCEDEDIGIIDNRTSLRDPFSRTSTYNTYHRSSSIDESYRSSQTWSYPSSSLNSSPGNEWLYKIHSSTTSTKPSQSSVKPVLYPPSLLPSFETSFTAQKPSPSPKGLTPPKPTTPSLKPSSSSFKPSPSLKPTLSELGKGKYKTLNPEDTLPIKPILYPPSPLPSFKMSFTAEKPSPSPKGLTPPKSTTPSPKRSSSSSKPSPSLKPTLSELGKGKYKTVDPKDMLPIYMIPKDIEDLIKRDIVPEVLKKPLSASTYQDFFAALLYAEDSYIEKWSSFELENVSMELHSATIYQKSGKNKHSKASKKMDDKTFAVFKVDSLSMTRPFLLSRDFVFAKRVGKETEPFQGVLYRVVKSTTILVEFGEEFHSQHHSTCRYNISFSFNRVCLKRAHQAIAAVSASLIGKFLFPNSFSQHSMHNSEYYNLYDHNLNLDEKSAVHRILNIRAPPPFLVKGPLCATFNGNSESISKQLSRTGLVVKEAVLQIYRRHPQSKILVCAPINSTCDVLTRSLKIDIPASDIFRANAAFREIEGVPIDILPSCLYKRDTKCFSCPSLHELREFRVIFSTFTSSYRLYNAGISAGHFSHIFLVDASSSTEPETLVALANFADDSTTVIITGAPGNCSSTVRSDIAREKGLRISYFERLCKLSPFKNDDPMFIAQLKDRSL
ncbi:putative RNA helicase SDE3 -like protein [Gossypium arboreum]|uniref:Putative RNA helicase SDE3-like protein n=1 Tax=Gossypium arboreum TaxID=29729 RepID=A0A0B0N7Z6_GOSAR|nr:probable RNA helicase SDE3 [Gossypium arboreum]XP_052887883.1 probable RNA helicase SDE3 [Gossypium arboreum]KHG07974.1 putative RNA helicase SDE3 -like protein [Gossypium arboreum]